jgi:hypothetical protein
MARVKTSASRPSSLTSMKLNLYEGVPGYLAYLIKRKKVTVTLGLVDGKPVAILKYRLIDLWNFRLTRAEYERQFGHSSQWKTYYPFRAQLSK